jgi:hypothetical protein
VALPDSDPCKTIDERIKRQAGLERLGGQGTEVGPLGLEVLQGDQAGSLSASQTVCRPSEAVEGSEASPDSNE